VTYSHHLQTPL